MAGLSRRCGGRVRIRLAGRWWWPGRLTRPLIGGGSLPRRNGSWLFRNQLVCRCRRGLLGPRGGGRGGGWGFRRGGGGGGGGAGRAGGGAGGGGGRRGARRAGGGGGGA